MPSGSATHGILLSVKITASGRHAPGSSSVPTRSPVPRSRSVSVMFVSSVRRVQVTVVLLAGLDLHCRVADVEAMLELVGHLVQERAVSMPVRHYQMRGERGLGPVSYTHLTL